MEAFAKALVREAHNLRRRPDLLWQQLYNRLQWAEGGVSDQVLEPELAGRTKPGARPWLRSLTRLGESQALIRTLAGHTGPVYTVAYSPDGTHIVSGSYDGTLKIWDTATSAELGTLGGHTARVEAAAYSPDGTRIVSVSSKALTIWDTATGAELTTLSSDSTWLAKAVAWSPDGTRIVSGSACQAVYGSVSDDLVPVTIWDAASGAELLALRGHATNVQAVAWSPDGTRIVSGDESGRLKIWEAGSGAELTTLAGHPPEFVVSDEDLARARADSTKAGIDISAELELIRARAAGNTPTEGSVNAVAWSPDGTRIVSGSRDGTLKIWESGSGAEVGTLSGHTGPVDAVAWSPDGTRIVSGSRDGTLKIWESGSGAAVGTLSGHTGPVDAVAWSPDGTRIVSGSQDGTVKLWEGVGAEVATPSGHTRKVNAVSWSPDGTRIVSGSEDTTLKIWDGASGTEIATLATPRDAPGRVKAVAWSPDGTRIASAAMELSVWDAASGAELAVHRDRPGWVEAVDYAPDGAAIVTGTDDAIQVWDTAEKSRRLFGRGHALTTLDRKYGVQGTVNAVACSPDGVHIAFSQHADRRFPGSRNTLNIWDTDTGENGPLTSNTGRVCAVAYSPDGTRIVSGSHEGTLKIWESGTGAEIATLTGHAGTVNAVAWSPDGTRIVSGSADNTLRVWDARQMVCLAILPCLGAVGGCDYSPQGRRICYGDETGIVHILELMGVAA